MYDLHRNRVQLTLLAFALSSLAGCSSFNTASARVASIVSPYKSDIVQGNVVTREQMTQIKPGMSKAQVRDILGTVLLASVFHADRWDYVFTLQRQGIAPQARKVTLFFKDGNLDRSESDDLPSETEFVSTLQAPGASNDKPVLEATEEMLAKYPKPTKPDTATVRPVVDTQNYPPLEPPRRQSTGK